MTKVRAGRRHNPLKLDRRDNVGISPITQVFFSLRVKKLKARREHDCTHIQFDLFFFLFIVNGVSLADLFADLAFSLEHVHTVSIIDGRFVGNRLGIGDVRRRALVQPFIILIQNRDGFALADLIKLDPFCRTDKGACAADLADIGMCVKRRADLTLGSPEGKTDGIDAHSFLTHTDTQPAQKTVFILFPEPCFLDAVFLGDLLDRFRIRTQCQLQFDHRFPCLFYPFRIRVDRQIILCRVSARRLDLRSAVLRNFYQTQPARSVGTQSLVVAESGDL